MVKGKTQRDCICSLLVLVAIGAVIVLVQPTLALLGSVNAQGVSKPMGNGLSLTFSKAFSPSTIGPGSTSPKISASWKVDPFPGSWGPFWRPKF